MPAQEKVPEKTADFRFVGVLRDFLRDAGGSRVRSYGFSGRPSIKDAIEAQGIPHTEVDQILVDEEPVGFDHSLRDGDRVVVHPFSKAVSSRPAVPLREALPREPKFVADINLGKLARWLRLLGYDTDYRNDLTDAEIASIAARESRVVLTRDRRLLHQKIITHGYYVRSHMPEKQISEILDRYQLDGQREPFRRCLECNGRIRAVDKEIVLDELPPKTRIHYDHFFRCDRCHRVYWKGPHYERLRRKLIQAARPRPAGTESGTRKPENWQQKGQQKRVRNSKYRPVLGAPDCCRMAREARIEGGEKGS